MHVIRAAIPLFFLCILLELLWSQRAGRRMFRLNDSLSDLSCGVLSQMVGIFDKALTIGAFIWVAEHLRMQRALPFVSEWPNRSVVLGGADGAPWEIDAAALAAWVIAFVLVDLCYYWSHRMSHEVNVLWAGHVVHHQSEEFNLAVALRQASIGKAMTWVFYLPLALIGMPWQLFVVSHGINLIYQFIIHTRAVGKMGRLTEWVLNTPSHHRVHHGVNPKYQDKNYAGVFILFDRWFGTYQGEEEEPVYGITKPLRSWNPLWANLHVFVQMARDVRRTPAWGDRLRIVFGRPGWRPAALGGPELPPEVSTQTFEKFDPPRPRAAGGLWLRAVLGGDRGGVGDPAGRDAGDRRRLGRRGLLRGGRPGRGRGGLRAGAVGPSARDGAAGGAGVRLRGPRPYRTGAGDPPLGRRGLRPGLAGGALAVSCGPDRGRARADHVRRGPRLPLPQTAR